MDKLTLDELNRTHGLLNLEIRLLDSSKLNRLASIIDQDSENWTRLLEKLSNTSLFPSQKESIRLNLTPENVHLIEQQAKLGKSPTLALLNYWAKKGRRRPTLRILLGYLRLCQFKRAEDFICRFILGFDSKILDNVVGQLFPHSRDQTLSLHEASQDLDSQYKFDDLKPVIDCLPPDFTQYSFQDIMTSIDGKFDKPYKPGIQSGPKLGEGRFSNVYRVEARIETSNRSDTNSIRQVVAAKLLKSEFTSLNHLINEITIISRIKHENILELLGVSLGQETSYSSHKYICLIYPFMLNGSLFDCLSHGLASRNMQYLDWLERFQIATQVARGIAHLHQIKPKLIIHRDIKTANIFIDSDLKPKVGDFTLVRDHQTQRDTETFFSKNVSGTNVYMPLEAFRGDISIKFDSFSFGIVLLELLTGMKPHLAEHETDLLTYITDQLPEPDEIEAGSSLETEKSNLLSNLLDKKAANWDMDKSKLLFEVALKATEMLKENRPTVSSMLTRLEAICPRET